MLMFKTSAPSSSTISIAASMMSAVVDPSQPKHAIGVESDARGDALDRAVGADDAAHVRAVAVAVVWKRVGNRRRIEAGW